ncbi:hypothetical protein LEP1GSC037_3290 [Leptospira interrogans str. 2006001854]|uniref:Integrase core domain protein n=1 Tax=Leptospira interrogans str. 2006001854 TaxID=1001590 RepID=M6GZ81_LEPIR|nr:hypothetical protein LEP1GSC037_3290 [Leptospira interrogans str. 2006001854]
MIFHSDRGSNFCSKETRRLLIANGIRRSNSRKEIVGTMRWQSLSLVL